MGLGPVLLIDAAIVVSGIDVLLIRRSAHPKTEYSWLPPTGPRTLVRLTVPSPLKYLDIAAQQLAHGRDVRSDSPGDYRL